MKEGLASRKERLVLDLARLKDPDAEVWRTLRIRLAENRKQVRLILPKLQHAHPELLLLARMFHHSL